MNRFKTITGKNLDLSTFSDAERQALDVLTAEFDRRPDWEEFSQFWQDALKPILSSLRGKGRTRHPLYQIAQDLEMRLGIAQGMVAEPDYRDYLIDQIEERFGSRYRFCKETKIPQAFLSQVLSGKKDFSVEMLRRAAQALGLGLALLPKADFAEPAEFSALRKTAALVASDLTRVTDIRENLTRYKSPRRQLDAFARERSIVGDPVVDEITRALEQIPEEKRAEEILRLLEEKQRKLEPLLTLLREKIASLADEPKMLSKGEHRGSPSLLRV